jgi:hypothetical protein
MSQALLAPGEAVAKLATHLSDGYFSTWPRQYRIFLKLVLMVAPVADYIGIGCQERTGSLEGRPDALRASSIIDGQHRTTSTAILGFEERGPGSGPKGGNPNF